MALNQDLNQSKRAANKLANENEVQDGIIEESKEAPWGRLHQVSDTPPPKFTLDPNPVSERGPESESQSSYAPQKQIQVKIEMIEESLLSSNQFEDSKSKESQLRPSDFEVGSPLLLTEMVKLEKLETRRAHTEIE